MLLPRLLLLMDAIDFGIDADIFFKQLIDLLLNIIHFNAQIVQLALGNGMLLVDLACVFFDLVQFLQPQRNFKIFLFFIHCQVFTRLFRLTLQARNPLFQFADNVGQPHQILFGGGKLTLRFVFAIAEFRDTRNLFQHRAAFVAFAQKNLIDGTLADDGITIPTDTGIHKEFVDIAQARGGFIDEIFTLTAAIIAAGDHHFIIVHTQRVIAVINRQADFGKPLGFTLGSSRKDHIFHLGTAQAFIGLLTQYPADRVGDITFPRTVGSYDRSDPMIKSDADLIGKGLKSLYIQTF